MPFLDEGKRGGRGTAGKGFKCFPKLQRGESADHIYRTKNANTTRLHKQGKFTVMRPLASGTTYMCFKKQNYITFNTV